MSRKFEKFQVIELVQNETIRIFVETFASETSNNDRKRRGFFVGIRDGRGDQAALSRSSTRGESRLRWKSSSRSLSARINPASINALEAERAYHRCCQHQRRVVAPAKSLDARKHEPPAVSSISSSVSGSLRSRPPPCRSDASSSLTPHLSYPPRCIAGFRPVFRA